MILRPLDYVFASPIQNVKSRLVPTCLDYSFQKRSKYFEWLAPFPRGSKGWRSGESTRLQLCGPGSTSCVDGICGLSSLTVLFLAPRGFTPIFPTPQKPTFSNFNSTRNQVDASSETQGQIVGTRESLNGRKNMARRKVKNSEKSPWGKCLIRPVPNGRRRSDL